MRSWSRILLVTMLGAAPLAACGAFGGGSEQTDCISDVSDPDYGSGAPASFVIPVVSCSNTSGQGDYDQYAYPVPTSDFTVTCTLEEPGDGESEYLYFYGDPLTGEQGDELEGVDCDEDGDSATLDQDLFQPGYHFLTEVVHEGEGSRVRVTIS